ncbi:MAG: hypothetical protein KF802_00130 [Bdellovibrionaceae bacterium]|nr:hypothetical protein [Pseudobdellovibrionaceae bacterium]MBX3034777.1 hypothetical protein [Pseudobdellovibrionaceae bacterium]
MKRLLLLTATLFATQAHAVNLSLDLRGDLDAASYNKASKKPDNTFFTLHTARVDLKGEMNEELSYRLRFRLNDESAAQGYDKLSNRVDYAYISQKMEGIDLTLGKMLADVGGHETLQDSINLYYKSEANKALTGDYKDIATGTVSYFFPIKYMTGAKIGAKLGDSEFAIMGFNNPDTDNSATTPQSRFMSGAVFKGKFLDKQLQPVLSYHQVSYGSEAAAADPDHKAQLLAAGLKWDADSFYAQADYIDLKSGPLLVTAVKNDLHIQTTVAEGGLKMGRYLPKLTIESSVVKQKPDTGAELEKKFLGGGVALEYKPFEDKNMRYHIAYTQKTAQQDGADDKIENHLILGFMLSVK